ncbi:uncharacterized protein LOC141908050 [Tubulanus polymorphus]|uniref:uncharacterized protein LOC141908050 n=1 Tax=Tubulanus polymorphus TaxID=672921 RepID=UPI003DA28838
MEHKAEENCGDSDGKCNRSSDDELVHFYVQTRLSVKTWFTDLLAESCLDVTSFLKQLLQAYIEIKRRRNRLKNDVAVNTERSGNVMLPLSQDECSKNNHRISSSTEVGREIYKLKRLTRPTVGVRGRSVKPVVEDHELSVETMKRANNEMHKKSTRLKEKKLNRFHEIHAMKNVNDVCNGDADDFRLKEKVFSGDGGDHNQDGDIVNAVNGSYDESTSNTSNVEVQKQTQTPVRFEGRKLRSRNRETTAGNCKKPSENGENLESDKCIDCGVEVVQSNAEHENVQNLDESTEYRCSSCAKSALSTRDTDHGQCSYCDFKAKWKKDVRKHVNVVHPERAAAAAKKPRAKLVHKCGICDEEYPTKAVLNKHRILRNHHEQRHVCDQCGKLYATMRYLRDHIFAVHNEKRLRCPYDGCDVRFAKKPAMRQHVRRVHLRVKKIVCPYDGCASRFNQNKDLKQHVIVHHTKERNYACEHPNCGKSFKNQYHLTVHRRIHSDEKPLKCPYCEYRGRQRNSLNVHLRKHQKEGMDVAIPRFEGTGRRKKGSEIETRARSNAGEKSSDAISDGAIIPLKPVISLADGSSAKHDQLYQPTEPADNRNNLFLENIRSNLPTSSLSGTVFNNEIETSLYNVGKMVLGSSDNGLAPLIVGADKSDDNRILMNSESYLPVVPSQCAVEVTTCGMNHSNTYDPLRHLDAEPVCMPQVIIQNLSSVPVGYADISESYTTEYHQM